MSDFPVQADLCNFSKTRTPDEERLLAHYRASPWEDRTELLYRIARLRYAPCFAECFNRVSDARDQTYLHYELEQELKDEFPKHLNSSIAQIYDGLTEQQFSGIFEGLVTSGWPSIARVILGATEQDGRRADELYSAILGSCQSAYMGNPPIFSRRDALELIEVWREAVLQKLFRFQDD